MSTWITKYAKAQGLKKIDARQPLRLEVTKRDISTASKKDASCCAFANATKRQHDNVKAAFFFLSTAWIEFADGRIVRYLLPKSMQREIVAFDRNKTMEPGVYEVKAPGKTSRMSEIKKRSQKRPGRHKPGKTGRKQALRHTTTDVRTYGLPPSMGAA